MNAKRPGRSAPWDDLSEAEQAPYLREAGEYVTQSIDQGKPSDISEEETADAIQQTARDIYHELHPAGGAADHAPGFTDAEIVEQARQVSLALNKPVFAYREPEGSLRLSASPSNRLSEFVVAYDKGRRIEISQTESGRLGVRCEPSPRLSL
jgi:hypothetical protein